MCLCVSPQGAQQEVPLASLSGMGSVWRTPIVVPGDTVTYRWHCFSESGSSSAWGWRFTAKASFAAPGTSHNGVLSIQDSSIPTVFHPSSFHVGKCPSWVSDELAAPVIVSDMWVLPRECLPPAVVKDRFTTTFATLTTAQLRPLLSVAPCMTPQVVLHVLSVLHAVVAQKPTLREAVAKPGMLQLLLPRVIGVFASPQAPAAAVVDISGDGTATPVLRVAAMRVFEKLLPEYSTVDVNFAVSTVCGTPTNLVTYLVSCIADCVSLWSSHVCPEPAGAVGGAGSDDQGHVDERMLANDHSQPRSARISGSDAIVVGTAMLRLLASLFDLAQWRDTVKDWVRCFCCRRFCCR